MSLSPQLKKYVLLDQANNFNENNNFNTKFCDQLA